MVSFYLWFSNYIIRFNIIIIVNIDHHFHHLCHHSVFQREVGGIQRSARVEVNVLHLFKSNEKIQVLQVYMGSDKVVFSLCYLLGQKSVF